MDEGVSAVSAPLGDAMALHRAGRLEEAAAGYEAVLARDPANFDALHYLGVIALHSGNAQRAIDLLEHALELHPEAWPAIVQLGAAYVAAGRRDDAQRQFLRAIALAPDSVPAHEGLAHLWHEQGRLVDAAAEFGNVVRLQPNAVVAHVNLGTTLGQLERYGDALACYERALAIDPQHSVALLNAAAVLIKLGRSVEAVKYFSALLRQQPEQAGIYYEAGFLYYAQGMRVEAQSAFELAIARDPQHVEARWAHMIAELPLAYGPDEDPAYFRQRFADALGKLEKWFDAGRASLGHRAVGKQQPFYLAFHDVDNVPLLTRYGDLCARLMSARHPELPQHTRRAVAGRRVRVAIACGYFYDHSVWTAQVRGWVAQLDRSRIDVHLLHTGGVTDSNTAVAKAQAASFICGFKEPEQWIGAIRKLDPDILLYPEIGMDAMCASLASLRLAPVQIASGGHPVTTGLPAIDYYLSAELFEPPDGAAHYREQLVLLPNLGCYYEPLDPPPSEPDWKALGVDPAMPRLVCAGTPYKYFPEHDHVFVEIAQHLGRCQFLFFVDMAPRLSRQIEERLVLAFRRGGLDAARFIKFLPRQSRPAFFGLLRCCDVYLDTIGFSGFNSAIQAIEAGLPVVTLEGVFMRGRLAAGILKRMGMDELIDQDTGAYVDTAVRLCQDAGYRRDVGRRIASQRGILFRDLAPVRTLGDFLVSAATDTQHSRV
jgi:predicted O-linked N-acetylglucosamine transferase (SPINDLY family)